MSNIILNYSSKSHHALDFIISGSKSISQRALIINSLINFNGKLLNLSTSLDTVIINKCLLSAESILNVYNSGTSLRFLISFFALKNREVTLFGDHSLFQRPIKLLIEYLNILGASIYQKNNSVIIQKGMLKGGVLYLKPMKTSQFISSLILIAPYLSGGIKLFLPKEIYSKSYINIS